MKHAEYPEITNSYRGEFLDKLKLQFPEEINKPMWVVTEKIHGSNYSLWADIYQNGIYIRAGKRTDFIDKEEKFFNHAVVFDKYKDSVHKLAKFKNKDLVVFGELFGGCYGFDNKGTLVQKGVHYCPENDFMAFDIATIESSSTNPVLTFLTYDQFVTTCQEFQIPYMPTMFMGTLQECLDFNNQFVTSIPDYYGLKEIPENYCEGVVIRPTHDLIMPDGKRVMLKNKNDKFKEHKHIKRSKTPSAIDGPLLELITSLKECICKSRVYSVMSKHGETLPFGQVMKHVLADSIKEIGKEKYESLNKEQKHIVNKALDKDLAQVVRESLYADRTKKVG